MDINMDTCLIGFKKNLRPKPKFSPWILSFTFICIEKNNQTNFMFRIVNSLCNLLILTLGFS